MSIPSIGILIPFFGDTPPWFPLFFDSIRRNPTIDFIIFTDMDTRGYVASNVHFHPMCFEEYKHMVRQRTGLRFDPNNPYKLCDLKALLGWVHYPEIKSYDFYGFSDVDLVFGDIRSFYTEDLLRKFDVFSTHAHILSGHFALFRNTRVNRFMFQHIGGWEEKLLAQDHFGIDEMLLVAFLKWSKVMYPGLPFWRKWRLRCGLPRMYCVEQYTTPFTPIPWLDGTTCSDQPDTWFYKSGHITNSRDGDRKFIYLHFMNFKSSRYRHDGSTAPWENGEVCLSPGIGTQFDSFKIDKDGVMPMSHKWYLSYGP